MCVRVKGHMSWHMCGMCSCVLPCLRCLGLFVVHYYIRIAGSQASGDCCVSPLCLSIGELGLQTCAMTSSFYITCGLCVCWGVECA